MRCIFNFVVVVVTVSKLHMVMSVKVYVQAFPNGSSVFSHCQFDMTGKHLTWQENISHDREKSHNRKKSHLTGKYLTWQEDISQSRNTGKHLTWQEDISHCQLDMTGRHLTWQENISHDRKTSHMTGRHLTWQENISHDRKTSHMTGEYLSWQESISHNRKVSHTSRNPKMNPSALASLSALRSVFITSTSASV